MKKILSVLLALVCVALFANISEGALPSGYRQLEFIRTTGAQYVNTGLYFSNSTNAEVQARVSFWERLGFKTVFSVRSGTAAQPLCWQLRGYDSGSSAWVIRFDYNQDQINAYTCAERALDEYHLVGPDLYVNGSLCAHSDAPAFAIDRPLYLFATCNPGEDPSPGASPLICRGVKAWDRVDGVRTLVADFVPAEETETGVAGFYDVVRRHFYPSDSGTPFVGSVVRYTEPVNGSKDINNANSWGGTSLPEAYNYCILTNEIQWQLYGGPTLESPAAVRWGACQIGEVGGAEGSLGVYYWGQYLRLGDAVLANGYLAALVAGQYCAYFDGGTMRVVSPASNPFRLGKGDNGEHALAFGNGLHFVGDENAVLKTAVGCHATVATGPSGIANDYKRIYLLSGSPQYRGRWVAAGNARLTLGHPEALGGERETFAGDALHFYDGGSYVEDENAANFRTLLLDFDGTMPSRGRGIRVETARLTEFIVPTGRAVRCDMPVNALSKCRIHSRYGVDASVVYPASRLSLGAWEGSEVTVRDNVSVRFSSVGVTTATTLTAEDDTVSFWAEVAEDGTSKYTTIGANTAFAPYNGKIPVRIDFAEKLGEGTVRVPVMRVDTAAKVVTSDDFVLVRTDDFDQKIAEKVTLRIEVETDGTTQTAYFVAEGVLPSGYRQLEFIRTTGAQYVNTGLYLSSSTNAEVQARVSFWERLGFKTVFSVRSGTAAQPLCWQLRGYDSGSSAWVIRFDYNQDQINAYTCAERALDEYHLVGPDLYVNGSHCAHSDAAAFAMDCPLYLFATCNPGENPSPGASPLICRGVKAWDRVDGVRTLVADFVPAEETETGVAGLYDVVRRHFYPSDSGTPFVGSVVRYTEPVNGSKAINNANSWGGTSLPDAYNYCILTNEIQWQLYSGPTLESPAAVRWGACQIGEVGGAEGSLGVYYWGQYLRLGDAVLANGYLAALVAGQYCAYFDGGTMRVVSPASNPFRLGKGDNGEHALAFGNGLHFVGDEDAVLKTAVSCHATVATGPSGIANDYKRIYLLSGSPQYRGRWVAAGNARLTLGHPEALGGERETFAGDALHFYDGGSYVEDENAANFRTLLLDFDGTMPSRGRGIRVETARLTEFIVPTGHAVRCDMPVNALSKCRIHSRYGVDASAVYPASRLSLGAWEGSEVTVRDNVSVRFSSVGVTTATTLTAEDDTVSFWAEVAEDGTSKYTTIGANTAFAPCNGKIPVRIDFAEKLGKGAVRVPVMKIDTAAKIVTEDDFVLVRTDDFNRKAGKKASPRIEVETTGTAQTVYFVAEDPGLVIHLK